MDAPNDYKNAGLMLIISGALNAVVSLMMVMTLIWICIGVFWLVPLAIGAWQIMVGMAIQGGQPHAQGKNAAIAGIVAGAINLNPLPIVLAVLAMMNIGKPEVVGWLQDHGQS